MPEASPRPSFRRPRLRVVGPGWRPRQALGLLQVLLLALLGLPALLGVATAAGLALTRPVDDLRPRVDAVLSANGGTYVPIDAVPDQLSEALISIEDERFYQHRGIDTQGLLRALLADLYHRRALEGASTLSQQLVKNLYLQGDDDNWRKPEDLLLALKVAGGIWARVDYHGSGDEGWIDEAVVRDRNLLCSRTPDDLEPFSAAIIAALEAA